MTAVMAGYAVVVISAAPGVAAQTHDPQHAAADKAKPASGMAAKDHAMMAEREKMMTAMKAADQRLDALVAAMNTASGMAQTAATATVVTEMVAQSRTMRESMMKTQQSMMPHMMEHMQEGKDSMAMCPMMKQMGDMKH
ncbi:MAG: hypothetical protein Q7R30_08705 [Acidobacteriota bacterium]|nr:hypothetical protein [Acidobacteriota bacterium]